MYDDVESDFWKEIFVHLLHKNMVSVDAGRLTYQNCKEVFEDFNKRNPDYKPSVEVGSSYATWEVFVSDTVKLRLFVQNQIKGSLMQRESSDFVKVADARFPNNPFPQIEEFLSKKADYLQQLEDKKEDQLHNARYTKLLGQFMKANLKKHFENSQTVWHLEMEKGKFVLKIDGLEAKTIELDEMNYITQIQSV